MPNASSTVKISGGGRIVIPAEIRKALSLEVGDNVLLRVEGAELRIISRPEGIRRAQARLRKYLAGGPSPADELIAERRAEAARE
ncbi:MAG: AbrB/MazE/SpoVT family DNA-binding domain-containing protein [Tepidiformaceae bacterium]